LNGSFNARINSKQRAMCSTARWLGRIAAEARFKIVAP
jgi:hypothetical protein